LLDKQRQGKELNEGELEELKELQRPNPADQPKVSVTFAKSGNMDVTDSVLVQFDAPIAQIKASGIHLDIKRDTLWIPAGKVPTLQQAYEGDPFTYWLPITLEPDSSYRVTIDSAAVTSVYGLPNDSLTKEFKVVGLEEYANVYFTVNVRDSAFVELLGNGEKVIRTVPVNNGAFEILNVKPGTYYLRLTIDRNGNGKWDTGNYAQHLQPEEVYYYPGKLRLRRNWDLDQDWNIYQTALDLQKPVDIKRNKPEQAKNKIEKKKSDGTSDDEEDEEDEFGTGLDSNTYTGNKYRDSKKKLKRVN